MTSNDLNGERASGGPLAADADERIVRVRIFAVEDLVWLEMEHLVV